MTIYVKCLSFLFLIALIFSCGDKNQVGSQGGSNDKLVAKTGVSYEIEEIETDKDSKRHIEVKLKGFSENNEGHTFKYVDPIEDAFLLDMDKNGFEELYIVTRAVKGNQSSQVLGLSSNVDKSASAIITPDFRYKVKPGHPIYKNFGGHNKIFIENGELIEEYPTQNLYNADSVRIVKAHVFFELFINNGDWTLSPIRQINHKEE